MNRGTVKWFNVQKGYGFISQEGGSDIFVHYSDIVMEGYRKLKEGDAVEFDIVDDNGKKKAVNVKSVEG